jgi:RNA polymerase sigma-70 factor (ECF subfamily)
MDEPSLIRLAAAGDQAAFEMLVARHAAAILAVTRARTRDAALADEIAQDTFVRLFQNLSRFRAESSLRTWLVRVALNRCIDLQRSDPRRFEGTLEAAGEHASTDEGAERLGIRAEEAERVRRALTALPPPLRMVVSLRYDAGLSYAEIASALDVPIGTVGSRLTTALQQLRERLMSSDGRRIGGAPPIADIRTRRGV